MLIEGKNGRPQIKEKIVRISRLFNDDAQLSLRALAE